MVVHSACQQHHGCCMHLQGCYSSASRTTVGDPTCGGWTTCSAVATPEGLAAQNTPRHMQLGTDQVPMQATHAPLLLLACCCATGALLPCHRPPGLGQGTRHQPGPPVPEPHCHHAPTWARHTTPHRPPPSSPESLPGSFPATGQQQQQQQRQHSSRWSPGGIAAARSVQVMKPVTGVGLCKASYAADQPGGSRTF
jgi:hypothetical protein